MILVTLNILNAIIVAYNVTIGGYMKKSKIEKLMSIIPITLAFVIVGILVLGVMGTIKLNRFVIDFLLILGILCFGCISCLPATRILTKEKELKHHIYAYVIIGLTGLTCLLWIIFVFVGQDFINAISSGTYTGDLGILTYAKIVVFITVQTSIANMVISNVYTFKKEYLAFQIIMYVSNFIVDLWLTIVIMSLNYVEGSLAFTANWLFDSKFIWTIFVLSLAFSMLAGAILKSIIKKRTRDITLDQQTILKTIQDNNVQVQPQPQTIEERIKKLDELKEKCVITEDEYADKKAKILEEI